MKKLFAILIMAIMSFTNSGCEMIGNIFQAGIWVGIIVVIAVIAVIAFIFRLFSKR
ncbi:MAG: hypothetical protein IPM96_20205 [Ignavibacteria bacterium]|nr:hypothetical protein [Ignavibacteria bacterium]